MALELSLLKISELEEENRIYDENNEEMDSILTYDADVELFIPDTIRNKSKVIKIKQYYVNSGQLLLDYGYNKEDLIEEIDYVDDDYYFLVNEKYKLTVDKNILNEKYIFSQIKRINACKFDVIAYQRNGISEKGMTILPQKNEYCDKKEVVANLINEGLFQEFIDKWEDGETVFATWW